MDQPTRIKGGLYGALIGDALGVPYEFHNAADLPVRERIEMWPPQDFQRAHWRVAPGTWSDDGAHLLCLLTSLLENGGLDLNDLGKKLVDWRNEGYLAVDNDVFDIGIQTDRAIENLENGVPADSSGPRAERNNGNGSLMRVLPLALWHKGSDTELVQLAHRQSLPTHGHIISQVCCALYVLAARALLSGASMDNAWAIAETGLRAIYGRMPSYDAALASVLDAAKKAPTGSGYVVDSLWSARAACREASFEDVLKTAILFGNDTDTTACIAGGLAGIHFGVDAIPGRWMSALRGKELVEPMAARLLSAS